MDNQKESENKKTIKIRKVKSPAKEKIELQAEELEIQESSQSNIEPKYLEEQELTNQEQPATEEFEEPKKDLNIDFINWQYQVKEKKPSFYWFLFGFSAALIISSYYLNNWFLALFVVLGFVLVIQRNTQVKDFRIDSQGIYLQDQLFDWENIKHFDVEAFQGHGLVIVATNKFPFLKLYLPFEYDQHEEILYLLEKYSEYKEMKENFIDKITKKIIF